MPARIGELAHTFSYKIQYAGARMLFIPVNKNGATCGGSFENTKELHVMKYKKAMATSDSKVWELAIKAKHDRMVNAGVWIVVPLKKVPKGENILTSENVQRNIQSKIECAWIRPG
jgi:hypothetical protein